MAEKKVTKKKAVSKKASATSRISVPTPEQLLEAGVHFGHLKRRWHPKMAPYIFTEKEGVHVFDLYQTHNKLKEAAEFLKDLVSQGGTVIFVGTKRQASEAIEREAKRVGAFFITSRWVGGLLTNFDSVKGNIEKLEELTQKVKDQEFKHYTKKEQLLIEREIAKLEREIGGLRGLKERPGALVLASAKGDEIASREARQRDIPVVAVTDTNADPALVDYVIPGNDDSTPSIEILIKSLADAVEAGKKK